MDSGLYNAEYLTSMFSFDIMSFHRPAVKDPPLSEVTRLGTPKRLTSGGGTPRPQLMMMPPSRVSLAGNALSYMLLLK